MYFLGALVYNTCHLMISYFYKNAKRQKPYGLPEHSATRDFFLIVETCRVSRHFLGNVINMISPRRKKKETKQNPNVTKNQMLFARMVSFGN